MCCSSITEIDRDDIAQPKLDAPVGTREETVDRGAQTAGVWVGAMFGNARGPLGDRRELGLSG
jgi:hypothetical protein